VFDRVLREGSEFFYFFSVAELPCDAVARTRDIEDRSLAFIIEDRLGRGL